MPCLGWHQPDPCVFLQDVTIAAVRVQKFLVSIHDPYQDSHRYRPQEGYRVLESVYVDEHTGARTVQEQLVPFQKPGNVKPLVTALPCQLSNLERYPWKL
jgi:hypothetical protein